MVDTFTSTGGTATFYIHSDVTLSAPTLTAPRFTQVPGTTFDSDQSGQTVRHLSCTAHINASMRWTLQSLVGSYGTLTWTDGAWGVILADLKSSNFYYQSTTYDQYQVAMEFLVVTT